MTFTQTQALLVTLAVEVPVVVGLAAALRWTARRLGALVALAACAALASLVTHPLLWIVDPLLAPTVAVGPRWALLEGAIVVVEAGILALTTGIAVRRALLLSVAANGASLLVGVAAYWGA